MFYSILDVLLGKPTVMDDEIQRKVNSLLGEYFTNQSMEVSWKILITSSNQIIFNIVCYQDAVLDMKNGCIPQPSIDLLTNAWYTVLEHNRKRCLITPRRPHHEATADRNEYFLNHQLRFCALLSALINAIFLYKNMDCKTKWFSSSFSLCISIVESVNCYTV